ncbi:MAG: YebC/PmpR family DNA-binding transcriptional regulator [Coriobacteriaceae bacterium]|jgi:YebC/PmpR family DNA-binding regulatory protein|nr:MAG: YebC/PmpR family DNA-binding transcriptional regulator [Coriobacteriaceae bacterium]
MSGHSKWATTKHKKAAIDAKRSALFSKHSRNITVAARNGGDPNPDNNASLAAAIARARMVSMPNARIKAAIDKAFGSGADSVVYKNVDYEGYGPAGVALYVECLTDNLNRTAADVRSAFTHAGGNLGTAGSVSFQFTRKGSIAVEKVIHSDDKKVPDKNNATDEDEFMLAVAEAGGEDYEDDGDQWIVYTPYDQMQDVQKGLEDQGIQVKGSELTMIPKTPVKLDLADARKVQRLVDRLEDLDDVQNVYSTMKVSDEVAAQLAEDDD